MSDLGRFLSFLAIEDGAGLARQVEAERRDMYRRPDAPPLPARPRAASRARIRLPSFLARRGARLAGE
jgi:hypothetical protein